MKIKDISDRRVYNAFKRWYEDASGTDKANGMRWYAEAQSQAKLHWSQHLDGVVPFPTFVRVIAMLSPRLRWEANIQDALTLIVEGYVRKVPLRELSLNAYRTNAAKALATLEDTNYVWPATSMKTSSFYSNLLHGGGDIATIDTWMIRAVLWHPARPDHRPAMAPNDIPSLTKAHYVRLGRICGDLAYEEGIEPAQMQAIIWERIRRF
jgi:hypothetical protein